MQLQLVVHLDIQARVHAKTTAHCWPNRRLGHKNTPSHNSPITIPLKAAAARSREPSNLPHGRYNSSSARKYSPQSVWWKATMPLGSIVRHSLVDLAVTPKPSGMSAIE